MAPATTVPARAVRIPRTSMSGPRAERNAEADFSTALKHGLIEDAAQSHTRQQQPDEREENRQRRQQPLADHLPAHERRLRCHVELKFRWESWSGRRTLGASAKGSLPATRTKTAAWRRRPRGR